MLIKSVTPKGGAVLVSPRDAAISAIEYAVSSKNTKDTIYWIERNSIDVVGFTCLQQTDGGYTAEALGYVMMGYTDVKTDTFFVTKKYAFEVSYRSSKDELGLPDIDIDKAKFTLVEADPSAVAGHQELVVEKPIIAKKVMLDTISPKPVTKSLDIATN